MSRQPDPAAPGPGPAPDDLESEIDARLAVVRARFPGRLGADDLAALRQPIEGIVRDAWALRAVALGNEDEPAQPFAPYRGEP